MSLTARGRADATLQPLASPPEGALQGHEIDSLHADELLARARPPDDRDARRRDACPARDQTAQGAIRPAVHGGRRDPGEQHAVAEADQLLTASPRLQAHRYLRAGHSGHGGTQERQAQAIDPNTEELVCNGSGAGRTEGGKFNLP